MPKDSVFPLRLPKDFQDKIYKISSKKNKSVNKTIIRLLSDAIMNEKNYFELQFIDNNERFSFKDDLLKKDETGKIIKPKIYRYVGINKNNGAFVCIEDSKTVEFKFSENFYKPIFIY